jgi:hypothetical protein
MGCWHSLNGRLNMTRQKDLFVLPAEDSIIPEVNRQR